MFEKGGNLQILLAEDNAVNQRVITLLLEKHGHTVVSVNNGREAVEAHREQQFDLVLMDIQMPEMSGIEATARIRERERSGITRTPIIAVSANLPGVERERCLAAGMDDYIAKPIRTEELLQAIAKTTGKTVNPTGALGRAKPQPGITNKRVLFVGDELDVLEELRRGLRPLQDEWEMIFVGSWAEGLELLARQPFDVVVTAGAADFLTEVGHHQPQAVKIALSDEPHRNLLSQPLAHRYLPKACDAETLRETIERACALRELLSDGALRELVSQMQSLPSLPALYLEMMEELRSPNSSIKKVSQIIERDLGMTAKILQTVNSATYGIRQRISSPTQAVNLLGLDTVAALVLTIQVFSKAKEGQLPGFSPAALWEQAFQIGKFAKLIAQAEHQPSDLIQDSITAGLLHDAGKLVLAANQPQRYARVLSLIHDKGLSTNEAELEVFGTLHSAVGAYLLWLWGLPDSVVEAVAYHTRPWPSPSRSFSPLTAVHAAKALADKRRPQKRGLHAVWLDLDYLTRLRLIDRIPVWREVCAQADDDEDRA